MKILNIFIRLFLVLFFGITFALQKNNSSSTKNDIISLDCFLSSKEINDKSEFFLRILLEDEWHAYAPNPTIKNEPIISQESPSVPILKGPVFSKTDEVLETQMGKVSIYNGILYLKFTINPVSTLPNNFILCLNVEVPVCKGNQCRNISKKISCEFKNYKPVENIKVLTKQELDDIKKLFIIEESKVENKGILEIILLAVLGGILLNFMPCVLPILSIKFLSILEQVRLHGKNSKKHLRIHGIIFTSGILFSFFALAVMLIIFKSQINWGFQLQSPSFILGLMALMLVMSLSLLGIFEFGIFLTRIRAESSNRYISTFLQGCLMVLISTPCTGPFMGTALAVALSESNLNFILIFLFLGLGVAIPFLMVSFIPQLQRFIPKPGSWMVILKQFFGFTLLAVVLWLSLIYSKQTDINSLFLRLFGLLFLSLSLWIYGNIQTKSIKRGYAMVFAVTFTFAGYLLLKPISKEDEVWLPYDEVAIKELETKHRPYIISFTADWCLTCKVNGFVLRSERITKKIKEKCIVAFVADYTNKNEEIKRALDKYGRIGVPAYIFYKGRGDPEALPEFLTVDFLERKIDAACTIEKNSSKFLAKIH